MTTRITIISVFGHRNKGDAAIFASLLSHLDALVPDVALTAVVRHPETESTLYPDVQIEEQVLRSTADNRLLKGAEMLAFALGSLVWLTTGRRMSVFLPARKRRALEAIAGADLVVSCGGGFLHDSFPGFVVHLFEMYVTKRLGRPLILVAQSIGPLRRSWSRRLTRSVLDRCDVVLPRERISQRYLIEELGVEGPRIVLIPDLAFSPGSWASTHPGSAMPLDRRLDSGEDILGVTVRAWNFPGDRRRVEELNEDFQRRLASLLDLLVEEGGLQVVFFPQAITADFGPGDDRSVSRKVAARMERADRVTLIEDDLSIPELRRMIGRCRLFVGTRMHSNIFAITAGVPTLGIAYLPKTRGIMELAGFGELVVDMDDDLEHFSAAARHLVKEQEIIRASLRRRIPELQAWIRGTLSDVLATVLPEEER